VPNVIVVTSKAKILKGNILNSLTDLIMCGSKNGYTKMTRVPKRMDYILTNGQSFYAQ
jgi:hypothetical protein